MRWYTYIHRIDKSRLLKMFQNEVRDANKRRLLSVYKGMEGGQITGEE